MEQLPDAEGQARQTLWGKFRPILFPIMIVTPWVLLVLLGSHNILFAPPYARYTLILYGVLVIGSMVSLEIGVLRYRKGSRSAGCYLAVGFGIIGCFVMVVLLALFGSTFGTATAFALSDHVDCSSESLPEARIRYVCTVSGLMWSERYTLEGFAGSPFVWVVKTEIIGG